MQHVYPGCNVVDNCGASYSLEINLWIEREFQINLRNLKEQAIETIMWRETILDEADGIGNQDTFLKFSQRKV